MQQDIAVEREKRLAAKKDVEDQLKRAEKLEIGSEIGHGQIERSVEVEIGSDLEELMGAEIVVEDGKIVAFRRNWALKQQIVIGKLSPRNGVRASFALCP